MLMMWQRHQCGPERANVSQVSQTAYELFSRLNNSKLLPFPALFLLALVSSICLSSKPNISNVSVPFSISLSISANYLRRPVQHGLAIHYSHSLIVFLFPLHFFESCMLLMCPLVGHLWVFIVSGLQHNGHTDVLCPAPLAHVCIAQMALPNVF